MLSEIKSLASHTNQINHMVVYKDKLISCSWDRTIKIWELNLEGKDAKLIRTLEGHSEYVTYLVVYKDKLISCSGDKTIKIWNLEGENIELIRTLEYNYHPYYDINYMVVYKNTLISCAWSKNIKIWNLDNENVEESLIHANNLIFYKGYLYGHS